MSEQVAKVIIGLTGNIATGKSVVTRLASEYGAYTIDADKVSHEIMDADTDMQAAIADAFGSQVRRSNGRINRQALGEIVFANDGAMRQLEELVHPSVQTEIYERIKNAPTDVIFIEAIKLLEGPLMDICHQIWVTRCSKQRQLERLRVCRGMETPAATSRIKAQSPQEDKIAMADVVIDTDGFMSDTLSQFEMGWQRLPTISDVELTTLPDKAKAGKPKPKPKPKKMITKAAPSMAAGDEIILKRLPSIPRIERPEGLEVRRARPNDIPSILLLIQKATGGKKKMSRSDLLMALSERGYFIGQSGTDITTVIGWHIDSQIGRIDEIYIYPPEAIKDTTIAVIEDIEKSTDAHICENCLVFLPKEGSEELKELFMSRNYLDVPKEALPRVWQIAIEESQPEDTIFLLRVLREDRFKK